MKIKKIKIQVLTKNLSKIWKKGQILSLKTAKNGSKMKIRQMKNLFWSKTTKKLPGNKTNANKIKLSKIFLKWPEKFHRSKKPKIRFNFELF